MSGVTEAMTFTQCGSEREKVSWWDLQNFSNISTEGK